VAEGRYTRFLMTHGQLFLLSIKERKKWGVQKLMSKVAKTRTSFNAAAIIKK
jgi:hypothetical protein